MSVFSSPRGEKRRDLRVPVRVEIEHPAGGRGTEYAINLSAGGLCLQTRDPLAPGDRLRLRFSLPCRETPIEAEGEVVWASRTPVQHFREAGLRFVSISRADAAAIEAFVEARADGS